MARPEKTFCTTHNIPRVRKPRIRKGLKQYETYCRLCDNARKRKYVPTVNTLAYRKAYNERPEVKARKKEKFLMTRYEITLNDFNKLREKQNYRCAICDKSENESVRGLHVDHINLKDGSKLVRGLLCGECNKALGLLQENHELALKAASYIALRGS